MNNNVLVISIVLGLFLLLTACTRVIQPQPFVCSCDVDNYITKKDANQLIDLTNNIIDALNECENSELNYLSYYEVE